VTPAIALLLSKVREGAIRSVSFYRDRGAWRVTLATDTAVVSERHQLFYMAIINAITTLRAER